MLRGQRTAKEEHNLGEVYPETRASSCRRQGRASSGSAAEGERHMGRTIVTERDSERKFQEAVERIRSDAQRGMVAGAPTPRAETPDSHRDRLLKYIPAEILSGGCAVIQIQGSGKITAISRTSLFYHHAPTSHLPPSPEAYMRCQTSYWNNFTSKLHETRERQIKGLGRRKTCLNHGTSSWKCASASTT